MTQSSNQVKFNPTIKKIVTAGGIITGLSGIDHGFFEILQGNIPTGGFFIEAISPSMRFWIYGGESAITIIPNFLAAGILSVLIGTLLIIWAIFFIQKHHGILGFLVFSIIQMLMGGGIAFWILAIPTALFATRINRSLEHRQSKITEANSDKWRKFGTLWSFFLIIAVITVSLALIIAIFGYIPGLDGNDPLEAQIILYIVFGLLGTYVISYILAYLSAITKDSFI